MRLTFHVWAAFSLTSVIEKAAEPFQDKIVQISETLPWVTMAEVSSPSTNNPIDFRYRIL